MNPVSFGSVHKIYSYDSDTNMQKKGLSVLQYHCDTNNIFYKEKDYSYRDTTKGFFDKKRIKSVTTISAEKHQDHDIDMICANYVLDHEKIMPQRASRLFARI